MTPAMVTQHQQKQLLLRPQVDSTLNPKWRLLNDLLILHSAVNLILLGKFSDIILGKIARSSCTICLKRNEGKEQKKIHSVVVVVY